MDEKARIVLRRSSEWINRARKLQVFIDGQQAGTISNGGTEDFRVDHGQHTISCKVDWCCSRDFNFTANDETTYLFVQSGMKYYWLVAIPLFAVLALNFYYVFGAGGRPVWMDYLLIIVALPALLYLLYYVTFGRKDYLIISKDDGKGFANK